MKKFKRFMKRLVMWLGVVISIIVIAYVSIAVYEAKQPMVIERDSDSTVLEQVKDMTKSVEVMENDVQEARRMLEEATEKLNAEEEQLLKEIDEREAKIEEINEIRASF